MSTNFLFNNLYYSFLFIYVGEENCASVWSFSFDSVVGNDINANIGDLNSPSEHEDLYQNSWMNLYVFKCVLLMILWPLDIEKG